VYYYPLFGGRGIAVEPTALSAVQAVQLIRQGQLSAEELMRACLARIDEREPAVKAWTFLDPEYALSQAGLADQNQRDGKPLGPLHGVPIAIKDIIDTCDMPTENGSVLHAGRQPQVDATVVARLRGAGAIILGKTVTTEFAMYTPGKTHNPHDLGRTPGGSSSGSAAAVADGMVPLALGSQTNGSVIRPASYCGVVGFKPSHGLISRQGMLTLSRSLDHVGVFARSVEDAALCAKVLTGYDEHDPATRLMAPLSLQDTACQEPPVRPRLAFIKSPVWDQAEADTRTAFAALLAELGGDVTEAKLSENFTKAIAQHTTIMEVEEALNLNADYEHGKERMSARLCQIIERGREIAAVQYLQALAQRQALLGELDAILRDYDAILTPAATGVAPKGLEATGNPIFCSIWTLLGVPALTLPLLQNGAGLPLGVQLIGAKFDDARLLRTARWLTIRYSATS